MQVTALSVLAALVFWGSLWGLQVTIMRRSRLSYIVIVHDSLPALCHNTFWVLQGAVLSVPLLAAMKIVRFERPGTVLGAQEIPATVNLD